MRNLLIDSIEVFGLGKLKMLSSHLKNLINIEFYYNHSMNIAEDLLNLLIMCLE
jgi:hypothetical protein